MIKNKKGFTLIELIIVMAIIGILAVVAVVAIGSKSADARDARRLADMSAVRTALALHCAEPSGTSPTTDDTDLYTTAAAELIPVSTVGNAATTYIALGTISDPHDDATTACVADTDGGVCEYAFGTPAAGAAFGIGDQINACDYRINFYQEGGDLDGYAADEGLVE